MSKSKIPNKQAILDQLVAVLDERIGSATEALDSARESRDSLTKSSAGDKYETGREMMQVEMEKNQAQLHQLAKLKNGLIRINLKKKYHQVEFGSLVVTSEATYFISVGLGLIEVDNTEIYCISLASPIGLAMEGKSVGEKINFQGRMLKIQEIA